MWLQFGFVPSLTVFISNPSPPHVAIGASQRRGTYLPVAVGMASGLPACAAYLCPLPDTLLLSYNLVGQIELSNS